MNYRGSIDEAMPNENLPLGTSVFREFFSNLTEVLFFFKMSKKRSNYESSVYLRIYVGEKKVLFWFLAIFDKNTGHKVTKIYPVYRINITYKFYFMTFSVIQKNKLSYIYIYASLSLLSREGRDGVVGRAVVSGFENPGSSPPAANLFFFF